MGTIGIRKSKMGITLTKPSGKAKTLVKTDRKALPEKIPRRELVKRLEQFEYMSIPKTLARKRQKVNECMEMFFKPSPTLDQSGPQSETLSKDDSKTPKRRRKRTH